MSAAMSIEPLRIEHVDAVASLHADAVDGLLAQLGSPAIRAYYRGAAASPLSLARVSVSNGRVLGFVLGALSHEALRADIVRRNPLGIAMGVAGGLLRRPGAVRMLFADRTALYDASAPELLYLGVAPDARGRGVGAELVRAFGEMLRAAGHRSFQLSVTADNADAIAFYEHLGFRRIGAYRELGRQHYRYAMSLTT